MAIVVPVLRESERAIEALRAAEGALWAEQLADLITLAARSRTGQVIRQEAAGHAAESVP